MAFPTNYILQNINTRNKYMETRKIVKVRLNEKKSIVRKTAEIKKMENPTVNTVLKLNNSHLMMASAIKKMENNEQRMK